VPGINGIRAKMGRILITNLFNKVITFSETTRPLLFHVQAEGLDWMHACGAKGRCTTCKFNVLDGMENVQTHTSAEQKYLEKGGLKENQRLACQAIVAGDITISIPDENKLPHIHYSA
jgi:ferredoxin, 2Fe-2S